jgi:hypothetical protein
VATLVPVAGTASPGFLSPDKNRRRRSTATGRKGPAVRKARSKRARWLAVMAAADVTSVAVVCALVTLTATPVAPAVVLAVAILWAQSPVPAQRSVSAAGSCRASSRSPSLLPS